MRARTLWILRATLNRGGRVERSRSFAANVPQIIRFAHLQYFLHQQNRCHMFSLSHIVSRCVKGRFGNFATRTCPYIVTLTRLDCVILCSSYLACMCELLRHQSSKDQAIRKRTKIPSARLFSQLYPADPPGICLRRRRATETEVSPGLQDLTGQSQWVSLGSSSVLATYPLLRFCKLEFAYITCLVS